MTYSLVGRCPRTYQLGAAMATSSLAVGGYCPFIDGNVAALSTQAFANPQLGPVAMRLLGLGLAPDKVLRDLDEHDQYFAYRQLMIVNRDGIVGAWTGDKTPPWAGHEVGEGFMAAGNALVGREVVGAMADSFRGSEQQDLAARLLLAVEAGREAGGEPRAPRSASLAVYERQDYPLVDLRVDAHHKPIEQLRRLYGLYEPFIPIYYQLRAKEPDKLTIEIHDEPFSRRPIQELWDAI